MKPSGVPALSRRVREPRGVVVRELVVEGSALGTELADVWVLMLLPLEAIEDVEGATRDTIFMPVVVLVLAGMNSVV